MVDYSRSLDTRRVSDSPSEFDAFVAGAVSNPGTEFNDKLIPAGSVKKGY